MTLSKIEELVNTKIYCPIWEKTFLTVEEASSYSGIGISKMRQISSTKNCNFVLWNGSKRLINRRKLDEYLGKQYSI